MYIRYFLILSSCFALAARGMDDSAPRLPEHKQAKSGDVVLDLNLSDPGIRSQIERQGGEVVNEGPDGEPSLRISNTARKTQFILSFPVEVSMARGAKLAVTGKVRGEGVEPLDASVPLRSYEGIKFQFYVNSPAQGRRFFDGQNLYGTFPWRLTGRIASIPDDASQASIKLGIEKAEGTAWYSHVRVKVLQPMRVPVAPHLGCAPRTQLRGVMSPHIFNPKDFEDLAAWRVNLIRWQMWQTLDDKTAYNAWLQSKMDELACALDAAQARGMKVVVDLHSPPGGRLPDGTMRMFLEKEYRDQFISAWEMIARRFKGHPAIWGYDLINEPVQSVPSSEGLDNWLEIQRKAGKAIRAIDPETPIVVEVDEWDSPESFKWLVPLDITNVIYEAHMYWPGEYTHQGVRTNQGVAKDRNSELAIPYPGTHADKPLDKEALRRYLADVREFQLAYNVPIYIGEFSVIRWAPGGAQYLDDCISLFEEYGWNWTYHAFREWDGWSVEHTDLPRDRKNHPRAIAPTDRQKVIQKWFSKNEPASSK